MKIARGAQTRSSCGPWRAGSEAVVFLAGDVFLVVVVAVVFGVVVLGLVVGLAFAVAVCFGRTQRIVTDVAWSESDSGASTKNVSVPWDPGTVPLAAVTLMPFFVLATIFENARRGRARHLDRRARIVVARWDRDVRARPARRPWGPSTPGTLWVGDRVVSAPTTWMPFDESPSVLSSTILVAPAISATKTAASTRPLANTQPGLPPPTTRAVAASALGPGPGSSLRSRPSMRSMLER